MKFSSLITVNQKLPLDFINKLRKYLNKKAMNDVLSDKIPFSMFTQTIKLVNICS